MPCIMYYYGGCWEEGCFEMQFWLGRLLQMGFEKKSLEADRSWRNSKLTGTKPAKKTAAREMSGAVSLRPAVVAARRLAPPETWPFYNLLRRKRYIGPVFFCTEPCGKTMMDRLNRRRASCVPRARQCRANGPRGSPSGLLLMVAFIHDH